MSLFRRKSLYDPDTERRFYDQPIRWASRLPLILLLPGGVALQWYAARHPLLADSYAGTVYPLLSRGYGLLTGWIPLSVAEILLIVFVIWFLVVTVRAMRRIRLGSRTWSNLIVRGAVDVLAWAGALYGVSLLWGFNYHRTPLLHSSAQQTAASSVNDLRSLCRVLIDEANAARSEVDEGDDGVMRLADRTRSRFLGSAWEGFYRAEQVYESLYRGHAGRVKRMALLSGAVSHMGWQGVFVPLTGEPTVHTRLPDPALPFAACHQLAHQVGWIREEEADFVGWLGCSFHPQADFRYAAYLAALDSAMDALRRADPQAYGKMVERCSPGVRRDRRAVRQAERRDSDGRRLSCPRLEDLPIRPSARTTDSRKHGELVGLLIDHHKPFAEPTIPASARLEIVDKP